MSRFEGKGSDDYDARIKKLIPGYQLLHQLTASYLKTQLQSNARILVVGAGTGSDILELSNFEPSWLFTAVDISSDMLDIAKHRCKEANILDRVSFHAGDVNSVNEGDYDAAICLFVTHFIDGHDAKTELLSSIESKLKTGAFLLLADLMPPQNEAIGLSQGVICNYLGLEEKAVEEMQKRLAVDFYPLSESELTIVAKLAGYDKPLRYFQALRFSGFILPKVAS
ncbi:hypothetical protein A9Q99_22320 [Gammaproteobacteria bacterium 45_16_T64]|nr:hypothetical protein A9Q99_22320 [Gammaproteobacteria bacterium 45_16_T64]